MESSRPILSGGLEPGEFLVRPGTCGRLLLNYTPRGNGPPGLDARYPEVAAGTTPVGLRAGSQPRSRLAPRRRVRRTLSRWWSPRGGAGRSRPSRVETG